MRLLLIRHGESVGNAERRLQGHLDSPLNDRGRQEVALLAERLSRLQIDTLYTSPLIRASETAALVAEQHGLAVTHRDGLMERDVGEAAGLTREEILQRFPDFARARAEGRLDVDVPGWEQDGTFNERVQRALDDITNHPDGQTVAAVTHGGVIGAICRRVLSMPIVRPGPFSVDNTSITTVDVLDGDANIGPRLRLLTLNDTCHLDGM
jgi:broad specificity phosphatase PhoE